MITLTVLFFRTILNLLGFCVKAVWGIGKVLVGVVLLPLLIIGLFVGGLVQIGLPLLIFAGIVFFLTKKTNVSAGIV